MKMVKLIFTQVGRLVSKTNVNRLINAFQVNEKDDQKSSFKISDPIRYKKSQLIRCSAKRYVQGKQHCAHGAIQQNEMKARIVPNVKHVWFLSFVNCLYCVFINATAYPVGRFKHSSISTKELHFISREMEYTEQAFSRQSLPISKQHYIKSHVQICF